MIQEIKRVLDDVDATLGRVDENLQEAQQECGAVLAGLTDARLLRRRSEEIADPDPAEDPLEEIRTRVGQLQKDLKDYRREIAKAKARS